MSERARRGALPQHVPHCPGARQRHPPRTIPPNRWNEEGGRREPTWQPYAFFFAFFFVFFVALSSML